jgi:hypothetical protein
MPLSCFLKSHQKILGCQINEIVWMHLRQIILFVFFRRRGSHFTILSACSSIWRDLYFGRWQRFTNSSFTELLLMLPQFCTLLLFAIEKKRGFRLNLYRVPLEYRCG